MAAALATMQPRFTKKARIYELTQYEARSLIRFHNSCIMQVNQKGVTENILNAMETFLLIKRAPENNALVESLKTYYEKCKDEYSKTQRKDTK